MTNAHFRVPPATNEPITPYAPGTAPRQELQDALEQMAGETTEVPLIIGGEEIRTGDVDPITCPHDHKHVLGQHHNASAEHLEAAVQSNLEAWHDWSRMDWQDRAAIFMRAADLLAGPWRQKSNAATMLGQSKNAFQSEIDAVCELIDFWRFNMEFMQDIYAEQPISGAGMWNRMEQRPLEGFVFAVTPFNFSSIAVNLPTAPALMGNVAIWKPSSTQTLAAYWSMKLLEEAGLPPGVINLVPGHGPVVGTPALAHRDLAGVHFTGSTATFQTMWRSIGTNIENYKTYPRIVGETGGKDFVFAHSSADPDALVTALVRGAFEYQGQKCSAASRAFIPKSIWQQIREPLAETIRSIKMGDVRDFSNFVNAVIDQRAFESIRGYIEHAKAAKDAEILVGGECDDSVGWFIQPTVILTTNPNYKSLCEEIFGPVLTIYVYDDNQLDETLKLCDEGSPYGLTGAVFANDRRAVVHMADALRHTAGNFYINDKPTGAVVGQQPFGGSRASGTNDKAGSKLNLLRWVSTRTIKETFVPPTDYRYPFMG